MKKLWVGSILILLGCASGAFGDASFTLTGVTPGGTNMGGVFTSPYVATISGVGSGINVICDDFADDVFINESWNVVATDMSQFSTTSAVSALLYDTTSASQQAQDYLTAAILSAELLSVSSSSQAAKDLSFAIWDVFDPSASTGLDSSDSSIRTSLTLAQNLAAQYLTSAGGNVAAALALDNISKVTIYTADPKGGNPSPSVTYCPPGDTCKQPQEFLSVQMAEPSFITLLGVDLLGVGGLILFVRKRLAGSATLG